MAIMSHIEKWIPPSNFVTTLIPFFTLYSEVVVKGRGWRYLWCIRHFLNGIFGKGIEYLNYFKNTKIPSTFSMIFDLQSTDFLLSTRKLEKPVKHEQVMLHTILWIDSNLWQRLSRSIFTFCRFWYLSITACWSDRFVIIETVLPFLSEG